MIIGLFLVAWSAFADNFVSDRATTVYSQPNTESSPLGSLRAGREVEVDKRGRRWIRVVLKSSKGKKIGYILAPEAEGSSSDVWRLGLAVIYSSYLQSSRTFTDTDGSQTNISELKGTNTYFAIVGEWFYKPKLFLRGGIGFRSANLKGTAQYRASVPTAATEVEIKQEFLAAFGGARYNFWKFLWAGGYLEAASASKSQVFGIDSEKPTYFILQPALSSDFKVTKNIWIQPELRLSVFINSKPFILNPEIALISGWEF